MYLIFFFFLISSIWTPILFVGNSPRIFVDAERSQISTLSFVHARRWFFADGICGVTQKCAFPPLAKLSKKRAPKKVLFKNIHTLYFSSLRSIRIVECYQRTSNYRGASTVTLGLWTHNHVTDLGTRTDRNKSNIN